MKKTYQQPATIVVATATTLLQSASPNATIDKNAPATDPSEIESRRHYSVWGDDDEE